MTCTPAGVPIRPRRAMLPSLTTATELDEALRLPLVVLFKHSTACAISSIAMREMWRLATERTDLDVRLIDVRADRPLSNAVAELLGIRHESPQVIVLRHGEPVWHGSHYRVTVEQVERALEVELEV